MLTVLKKRQATAAFFAVSAEDDAIMQRSGTPIWLERWLSEKTREPNRSDLSGLAQWLQGSPAHPF